METDLGSHIYRKFNIATGVRYGSGHEDVGGLWLLLRVAADGVGIEEDLEDEGFWLCFSWLIGLLVSSEVRATARARQTLKGKG